MNYWPFDAPFFPLLGSAGGPVDQNASFQPDVGPPITRRRTSAQVEMWSIEIMLYDLEQLKQFEAWFRDDLASGSLPFIWRHPTRQDVLRFKFVPAEYSPTFFGAGRVRMSFSCMILPGKVWFADYVPKRSARIPDFVADYAADRYWIGQQEVDASDLDQISGTYLVVQQDTSGDQSSSTAQFFSPYSLFASGEDGFWLEMPAQQNIEGSVPQFAPDGVQWIAGFAE